MTFSWTVTIFFLDAVRGFFSFLPYTLGAVVCFIIVIRYLTHATGTAEKMIKAAQAEAGEIVGTARVEANRILKEAQARAADLEMEYQRKNREKTVEVRALRDKVKQLEARLKPEKKKEKAAVVEPASESEWSREGNFKDWGRKARLDFFRRCAVNK